MAQLTLAFLRNGSAPGGLQLYGWTAIDPQNNRTTVRLSNVRFNVAVPGKRLHLRRAEEEIVTKKVSFCDLFIARVRRDGLNRSSILQVPGVSPCYPGLQDPLRDER